MHAHRAARHPVTLPSLTHGSERRKRGDTGAARHAQVQAGSLATAASSAARLRWTAQTRSSGERHQALAGELTSTHCNEQELKSGCTPPRGTWCPQASTSAHTLMHSCAVSDCGEASAYTYACRQASQICRPSANVIPTDNLLGSFAACALQGTQHTRIPHTTDTSPQNAYLATHDFRARNKALVVSYVEKKSEVLSLLGGGRAPSTRARTSTSEHPLR